MITILGPEPTAVVCPQCGVSMVTKISSVIPSSTHICACIMCIVFFPLFWIPYCVSNDIIKHRCSVCNATLGTYIPPSSESRNKIADGPEYSSDNPGFNLSNNDSNHLIYQTDSTTHHSMTQCVDTNTSVSHHTSHSYDGDTGGSWSGGGDCGGGDSGGGGSCD